MSDIHELTLREYYESFAQSLKDEIEEEEEMSVSYFCKKNWLFFNHKKIHYRLNILSLK